MNKSLGCTGRGHSFGLLNLLQYISYIIILAAQFTSIYISHHNVQNIFTYLLQLLSNSENLANLLAVPFILWFVSLSNCQLFTKGGHTIHKDKGIETLKTT